MLRLPADTEMKKQLPKSLVYTKFRMNSAAQEKFDADISKMFIANEISERSVKIASGENVKTIFIIYVQLKSKDFDEKNIILLSKLIPQNVVFVLEYGEMSKLAVYHSKLMQTEWQDNSSLSISLKGITLDSVWDGIITQIGDFTIENGNTLDEQIISNEEKAKLQKEIEMLTKKMNAEKQPNKKLELLQKIKMLKKSGGCYEERVL